jgi:hypothetical protein
MNIRTGFIALALATGGALAAYAFTAQDPEMMKKFMEFSTPGDAHKVLDSKVGKWNLKVKLMMEPGKPTESDATADVKWVLGNRFLADETTGTFMGGPFNGHGHVGYDNIKKKYVATWMDTASTGVMVSEGTYDAATKTFNYTGESPDCMTGKYVKSRTTEKMVDKDHWVMSSYSAGPDGKEALGMEISYTRAK